MVGLLLAWSVLVPATAQATPPEEDAKPPAPATAAAPAVAPETAPKAARREHRREHCRPHRRPRRSPPSRTGSTASGSPWSSASAGSSTPSTGSSATSGCWTWSRPRPASASRASGGTARTMSSPGAGPSRPRSGCRGWSAGSATSASSWWARTPAPAPRCRPPATSLPAGRPRPSPRPRSGAPDPSQARGRAELRFDVVRRGMLVFDTSAGVTFALPPVPFARFRAHVRLGLGAGFVLRATEVLFVEIRGRGAGTNTDLLVERYIGTDVRLRWEGHGVYAQRTRGDRVEHAGRRRLEGPPTHRPLRRGERRRLRDAGARRSTSGAPGSASGRTCGAAGSSPSWSRRCPGRAWPGCRARRCWRSRCGWRW